MTQAANDPAPALVTHLVGAPAAMSAQGYAVDVKEHPEAQVHFTRDQLGGLLVEYVFDGNPPVRYEYSPGARLAAPGLAQLLILFINREFSSFSLDVNR